MKNNTATVLTMILGFVVCLIMFVGGGVFALWFTQNFAIVPKAEFMDTLSKSLEESESLKGLVGKGGLTQEQLDTLLSEESVNQLMSGEKDASALLEEVLQQAPVGSPAAEVPAEDWAMHPEQRADQKQGAFRFKFTPGENLKYRLSASITGEGMESIGAGVIDMNLDSAFDLKTQSVDKEGYGKLRMEFGDTQARGNFMGGPFVMSRGSEGTTLQMNGTTYIDSETNKGSSAGIPQLEFFDKPIDMEVAPNGVVTAIGGESGMGAIMGGSPMFTDIEFPEGELTEGTTWVSHVTMPVPGIGTPIPTTITNVFTGYKTVGNRLCAVIDQTIVSEQTKGKINAPASVLGAAMGFAMPEFKLNGNNKIYFDVENGQMVHSDLDMDLGIDIGQALGASGDQLGGLMENLGDILGDVPEFEGLSDLLPKSEKGGGNSQMKNSQNLLEMNVDIKAQMSLTDPPMPQ